MRGHLHVLVAEVRHHPGKFEQAVRVVERRWIKCDFHVEHSIVDQRVVRGTKEGKGAAALAFLLAVKGGLGVQLHGDLFAVLLRLYAGLAAGGGGVPVPGRRAADLTAEGGVHPGLDFVDVVGGAEALLESRGLRCRPSGRHCGCTGPCRRRC